MSGLQCRKAALRGQRFCYPHTKFRHPHVPVSAPFEPDAPQPPAVVIPLLEDRATLQIVIAEVMRALAARRLSASEARSLFYGLQLASSNLNQMARERALEEPVEDFEQAPGGPELGLERECPVDDALPLVEKEGLEICGSADGVDRELCSPTQAQKRRWNGAPWHALRKDLPQRRQERQENLTTDFCSPLLLCAGWLLLPPTERRPVRWDPA